MAQITNEEGFTLVESLIAMVLLSIISVIAAMVLIEVWSALANWQHRNEIRSELGIIEKVIRSDLMHSRSITINNSELLIDGADHQIKYVWTDSLISRNSVELNLNHIRLFKINEQDDFITLSADYGNSIIQHRIHIQGRTIPSWD